MNFVNGTSKAEVMFASDGSDIIRGGEGSDAIHGGFGKDIFVLDGNDLKEFIIDFEDGRDLIDLRETGVESFDQLIQMYQYDTDIVESTVHQMRLYLNLMNNEAGRVDIDETDFIFADTPVHTYTAGNDSVRITSNEYAVHFGNGGGDILNLSGMDVKRGTVGATLTMDSDMDGTGKFEVQGVTQHFFEFRSVIGTQGDDSITGSDDFNVLAGQAGDDTLSGGDGNDVLRGNYGADRLIGGNGRDDLAGGVGRDIMTGGSGADRFMFYASDRDRDVITDFTNGEDVLHIADWDVGSFSQLEITANGAGGVTVAYDAADVSFTLNNVSVSQLDASDFFFG